MLVVLAVLASAPISRMNRHDLFLRIWYALAD
jgi:hypothetical protein